ncbi:MAG: hypothetical protein JWP87_481 [Labilithrix sp.]|nr:hypothetical protein [Labilithrix sp.]
MSVVASRSVESAPSKSPSKIVNVALWVAQGLLALAFVGAGAGKLLGTPDMVALYEAIGVGQWFRYVTGILELTGAALVIVPRTRVIGAGLLASIMLGAITTHLVVLHNSPVAPLVLLVVASLVLWGRRAEVAGLIAKAKGNES